MLLEEAAVAVTPVGALGTVPPPLDESVVAYEDWEPVPALL